MKIDFWRAVGVSAGSLAVESVVWLLTYSMFWLSAPSMFVKDIVLTVLMVGIFARIYFKTIRPSATAGFYLGLVMAILPGIYFAVLGILNVSLGFPPPPDASYGLPAWYWQSQYLLALVALGTATAVGWHLGKK